MLNFFKIFYCKSFDCFLYVILVVLIHRHIIYLFNRFLSEIRGESNENESSLFLVVLLVRL